MQPTTKKTHIDRVFLRKKNGARELLYCIGEIEEKLSKHDLKKLRPIFNYRLYLVSVHGFPYCYTDLQGATAALKFLTEKISAFEDCRLLLQKVVQQEEV